MKAAWILMGMALVGSGEAAELRRCEHAHQVTYVTGACPNGLRETWVRSVEPDVQTAADQAARAAELREWQRANRTEVQGMLKTGHLHGGLIGTTSAATDRQAPLRQRRPSGRRSVHASRSTVPRVTSRAAGRRY